MVGNKFFSRVAISTVFGTIVSMAVACSGTSTPDENPDIAAQRKQARINAYGKSGTPNTTGKGGNLSAQAAARRGGR